MADQASIIHVDPWIIEALIFNESRWHAGSLRHESDGTCSVGLGQINTPCDPTKMAALQDPFENIRRIGRHIHLSREYCKRMRCAHGWLGLYNPGDPKYAARIRKVAKEHAARSPKEHPRRDVQDQVPALRRHPHHRAGNVRWSRDGNHPAAMRR